MVAVLLGARALEPARRADRHHLLHARSPSSGRAAFAEPSRGAASACRSFAEERFRLILQGIAAAKELQLRGRALFYADEAVTRTRGINTAYARARRRQRRPALRPRDRARHRRAPDRRRRRPRRRPLRRPPRGRASSSPPPSGSSPRSTRCSSSSTRSSTTAPRSTSSRKRCRRSDDIPAPAAPTQQPVPAAHAARSRAPRRASTFQYPTRAEPALATSALPSGPANRSGIVGPTGSGKSTLLDIILGFLAPDSGTVTIDGTPVQDCREGWQRSIGYVPQDVYLVDDTLRANVALGWRGDEIDDEAVAEAIRLAQLDDVVRELPDGRRDQGRGAGRPALRRPTTAGRPRPRPLHPADRARPRRGDLEPRHRHRAAHRRHARRARRDADDDRRHAPDSRPSETATTSSTSKRAAAGIIGSFDELTSFDIRDPDRPTRLDVATPASPDASESDASCEAGSRDAVTIVAHDVGGVGGMEQPARER